MRLTYLSLVLLSITRNKCQQLSGLIGDQTLNGFKSEEKEGEGEKERERERERER
jgi:hypothetical protein